MTCFDCGSRMFCAGVVQALCLCVFAPATSTTHINWVLHLRTHGLGSCSIITIRPQSGIPRVMLITICNLECGECSRCMTKRLPPAKTCKSLPVAPPAGRNVNNDLHSAHSQEPTRLSSGNLCCGKCVHSTGRQAQWLDSAPVLRQ